MTGITEMFAEFMLMDAYDWQFGVEQLAHHRNAEKRESERKRYARLKLNADVRAKWAAEHRERSREYQRKVRKDPEVLERQRRANRERMARVRAAQRQAA
jgi:hypothetical protein